MAENRGRPRKHPITATAIIRIQREKLRAELRAGMVEISSDLDDPNEEVVKGLKRKYAATFVRVVVKARTHYNHSIGQDQRNKRDRRGDRWQVVDEHQS